MVRWLTRRIGGEEVLRVREGEQFEFAGVLRPADFMALNSDEDLESLGFTVERVDEALPEQPIVVTRAQFFLALWRQGVIERAEALAAIAGGTVPSRVGIAIEQLDEPQRDAAEIRVISATQFAAGDELINQVLARLIDPPAIRAFFLLAKGLTA